MAGTALRNFMTRSYTNTGRAALESIGLSGDDFWKMGGDSMRSISDLKAMLDNRMNELHMGTQQQLQFWTKFAGQKMANQIMKIDPNEVREYKKEIEQGSDMAEKMNTVLSSTKEIWNQLTSAAHSFYINVGEKFLTVIQPVLIVAKNIVSVLSDNPIAGWATAIALNVAGFMGMLQVIKLFKPALGSIRQQMFDIRKISLDIRDIFHRTDADILKIDTKIKKDD